MCATYKQRRTAGWRKTAKCASTIGCTVVSWTVKKIEELKVGGIVKSGIWLVRDLVHANTCIERTIEPTTISNCKAAEEIRIMQKLNHPNFVRYIESFICLAHQIPSASIFMETPQFGTLEDLFKRYKHHKKRICEAFIWDLYSQLINALGYLQHGI